MELGGGPWPDHQETEQVRVGRRAKTRLGAELGARASARVFSATNQLRGFGQVASLLQTLCFFSEEGGHKLRAELPNFSPPEHADSSAS